MTAVEMTPHARAGGPALGPGPRHGWAVVAAQELRDLWLGTRGLALIFAYSVVLSVLAFLLAGNAELNLLDARESVGLFIRVTLGLGTLATLIIGADAISGERERGTLEHLLLTPVRRRDLVVGKLLAAVSVWIGSLAIAVPYVLVLARGPGIAGDALLALFAAGTLVAVALAAFGVAISSVCRTNRSSLIIAIVILLALAAPSQLPSSATRGALGDVLVLANPVAAGLKLAGRVIVDQATWASQWKLLISPAIASVVFTGMAVLSSRKVGLGG